MGNIDFKQLPPAAKVVLAFVPAIIIAVVFFYVGIKPKMEEIENINKAITKLDNEIKTNRVKVRKLAELKEKNRELKIRLAELKNMLPDEKEVSILLKQVSDLGVESGLEILLWKPSTKEVAGNGLYVEIPVSVEMIGGYHN
jgi:type IV pilus assembly protein PilO